MTDLASADHPTSESPTSETPSGHPTSERPNTWSMAVVHQYYRREFELAPRIVRDIRPDQVERFEKAKAWFAITSQMMHHHHVTEDDLMYPLLQGRVPQVLLDRMEDQHQRVAAAVDRTEAALAAWRLDDPASAETLATTFEGMLGDLDEHLDSEEDEIMPLVADLLTAEEYARQGVSGNDVHDPATLMMAFGAMVEQATPYEAAVMLSHPPAHVQAAWREHGEKDYRALMDLLRAGLEPIGRHAPISPEEAELMARQAQTSPV